MKQNKNYTLEFRRKRQDLTDYRKRLRILTSNKPRLVVRKSLNNIQANIVIYGEKGDVVKASSCSSNLKKFGWAYNTGNLPSAYLVGIMIGKKAKSRKINEAILDIGLNKSIKGSRIYAVLAGALDAGLKIPHSDEILPAKDRITGKHIVDYAKMLKSDDDSFKKQFASSIKNKVDILDMAKKFEEAKSKIEKTVE
jgi:large subunit ribosomal protein L18